jgi:hypothetical protein
LQHQVEFQRRGDTTTYLGKCLGLDPTVTLGGPPSPIYFCDCEAGRRHAES